MEYTITSGAIIAVSGFITAVGGAWLTIRKIQKDIARDRAAEAARIIQDAKEADALIKTKLEARIETVKSELKNLELNVNKDLEHIKETYNGEIRNLGNKIEDLRSELKNQHGQLVQLLTEMIRKDT